MTNIPCSSNRFIPTKVDISSGCDLRYILKMIKMRISISISVTMVVENRELSH